MDFGWMKCRQGTKQLLTLGTAVCLLSACLFGLTGCEFLQEKNAAPSTTTSTTERVLPEVSDGDFGLNGTLPKINLAFINPLDERMLQVVGGDVDLVIMSRGEKDENGTALSVTQLDIQNATTGGTTVVNYDPSGLPSKASDGDTTLTLQWGNGSVSILATSGGVTVLTNIDLNEDESESSEGLNASTNSPGERRLSEDSSSSIFDPVVTVTVLGCTGVPITTEAVTFVLFQYHDDSADGQGQLSGFEWPVSPTGGVYTRKLPIKPFSPGSVSEICRAVQKGSDLVCKLAKKGAKAFKAACLALAVAVGAVNAAAGAAAAATCTAMFVGAQVFCRAVGSPSDDQLFDPLCDRLEGFVDRHLKDQPVRIDIRVNGEDVASRYFPGAPTSWSTTVTAPVGAARVLRFLTDPRDPDEGESYVAEVELDCLEPGSVARLDVSGTDGYADSRICGDSGGALLGRCTIDVPGAESDVRDTITILQNRGFGWYELLSIFIIF